MVPLCLHAAKLRLWLLLLGTKQDEQIVDSLGGEYRERFMMHYNMPPFATGETGRVGSPKRREIGHGRLAKRALRAVIPAEKRFPNTLCASFRKSVNPTVLLLWPAFAAAAYP